MKVLDLFCGMGGWSIPFIEDGDEVIGVDIRDVGYPSGAKLILADIQYFSPQNKFDVVIGSPPCSEFSNLHPVREARYGIKQSFQKGSLLIREFVRIVMETKPKYWLFENVTNLEKHIYDKPKMRFLISKRGLRSVWANFELPLALDYHNNRIIEHTSNHSLRAKIPYPIARFVCDVIKGRV